MQANQQVAVHYSTQGKQRETLSQNVNFSWSLQILSSKRADPVSLQSSNICECRREVQARLAYRSVIVNSPRLERGASKSAAAP